jgi:hypothetical protein
VLCLTSYLQNMQEFKSHSKASEFVKLCLRDIAAANPATEQQGPSSPHPGRRLNGVKPHSLEIPAPLLLSPTPILGGLLFS